MQADVKRFEHGIFRVSQRRHFELFLRTGQGAADARFRLLGENRAARNLRRAYFFDDEREAELFGNLRHRFDDVVSELDVFHVVNQKVPDGRARQAHIAHKLQRVEHREGFKVQAARLARVQVRRCHGGYYNDDQRQGHQRKSRDHLNQSLRQLHLDVPRFFVRPGLLAVEALGFLRVLSGVAERGDARPDHQQEGHAQNDDVDRLRLEARHGEEGAEEDVVRQGGLGVKRQSGREHAEQPHRRANPLRHSLRVQRAVGEGAGDGEEAVGGGQQQRVEGSHQAGEVHEAEELHVASAVHVREFGKRKSFVSAETDFFDHERRPC